MLMQVQVGMQVLATAMTTTTGQLSTLKALKMRNCGCTKQDDHGRTRARAPGVKRSQMALRSKRICVSPGLKFIQLSCLAQCYHIHLIKAVSASLCRADVLASMSLVGNIPGSHAHC